MGVNQSYWPGFYGQPSWYDGTEWTGPLAPRWDTKEEEEEDEASWGLYCPRCGKYSSYTPDKVCGKQKSVSKYYQQHSSRFSNRHCSSCNQEGIYISWNHRCADAIRYDWSKAPFQCDCVTEKEGTRWKCKKIVSSKKMKPYHGSHCPRCNAHGYPPCNARPCHYTCRFCSHQGFNIYWDKSLPTGGERNRARH